VRRRLAPTGKAVDEAMGEGAGDEGLTVTKALTLIDDNRLGVDARTVVIIDEASMLGTPELKKLPLSGVVGNHGCVWCRQIRWITNVCSWRAGCRDAAVGGPGSYVERSTVNRINDLRRCLQLRELQAAVQQR
jgi:hypothetical protein